MSIRSLDNKPAAEHGEETGALAARALAALAGIRFGTVELVIHEGRVVQIERGERLRIEPPAATNPSG